MSISFQENTDEIRTLYDLAMLYDEEHASFIEDLDMYDILAREYGGPVLELGIGNARVGLELAARGREIWGIDLSPAMLKLAAKKALERKLSLNLHEADMANFDLLPAMHEAGHSGFGVIMVPFNSLCHLHNPEQLMACFARVRQHLRPGGVFAPSVFVPDPKFLYRDPDTLQFVDRFFSASRKEEVELYETNHYDPVSQLNHLKWFFVGQDSEETLERRFTLRMYYPQELRWLLRQAGFRIVEEWADYSRRHRTPLELSKGISPTTIMQTIVCS